MPDNNLSPASEENFNVDIKNLRERLNMNITQFSEFFGFKPHQVEKWELGEEIPKKGYERGLLVLVDDDPEKAYNLLINRPY
jgi:DNA-binding transcriptional regulator YiaG